MAMTAGCFALSAAQAAKLYVSPEFLNRVRCKMFEQEHYQPLTRAERALAARHYQEPMCDHLTAAAAILTLRQAAAMIRETTRGPAR